MKFLFLLLFVTSAFANSDIEQKANEFEQKIEAVADEIFAIAAFKDKITKDLSEEFTDLSPEHYSMTTLFSHLEEYYNDEIYLQAAIAAKLMKVAASSEKFRDLRDIDEDWGRPLKETRGEIVQLANDHPEEYLSEILLGAFISIIDQSVEAYIEEFVEANLAIELGNADFAAHPDLEKALRIHLEYSAKEEIIEDALDELDIEYSEEELEAFILEKKIDALNAKLADSEDAFIRDVFLDLVNKFDDDDDLIIRFFKYINVPVAAIDQCRELLDPSMEPSNEFESKLVSILNQGE